MIVEGVQSRPGKVSGVLKKHKGRKSVIEMNFASEDKWDFAKTNVFKSINNTGTELFSWSTFFFRFKCQKKNLFLRKILKKEKVASCGARTRDPEIKSLMLFRLS